MNAITPNRDAEIAETIFSLPHRQVKCHHPLLIYTFVPTLKTVNSNITPQLHQLIRQFIVINSMPTKHTFITHHPIIYAQLRYLTQQYALALLQVSDAHDLATANIGLQEVICHWHIIPLPETNHPQYHPYNLAEHHSLAVTLPKHHIRYLQLIFNKLTTPYNLNTSPVRPAAKKPRYNNPREA